MSLLEALRQIEARSRHARPSTARRPSEQPAVKMPPQPEYAPLPCVSSALCTEATSQQPGVLEMPADGRLLSNSTVCAPEDNLLGTRDSLIAAAVAAELPPDLPADLRPESSADLPADLPVEPSADLPPDTPADAPATLPFTSGSQAPAWEPAVNVPKLEVGSEVKPGGSEVQRCLSPYPTHVEPEEPEKQPYEKLAERIAHQLSPAGPAVLMFTSAEDGAGKTQMLFSLAAALLDQVSGEVLAVDANLRAPDLAGCFGLEPARGLNDLLLGAATSRELVRRTPLPRLSLLPAVKACSRDGQLPANYDFGPLVKELTATYPLVLIDAPSLAHPETAAIGRHCDGIYLVVRLGHTARRALRDAVGVIHRSGGRLLGCVVIKG